MVSVWIKMRDPVGQPGLFVEIVFIDATIVVFENHHLHRNRAQGLGFRRARGFLAVWRVGVPDASRWV